MSLRLIFFGMNGKYSLSFLSAIRKEHSVAGIVESAPRPKTPSQYSTIDQFRRCLLYLRKSQLYHFATTHRIPYFLLGSKDQDSELIKFILSVGSEVGCIASFSRLISPAVIGTFPSGIINLHPSLLPKLRGPNPWFWTYYNMEKKGGVTIHYVDEGEDTGDILLQEEFEIPLGMRFRDMQARVIEIGQRLMIDTLRQIENRTIQPVVHRHIITSPRARNIRPDERFIDWENWPVERVFHVLRGTQSWLHALENPPWYSLSGKWHIAGYEQVCLTGVKPGEIVHVNGTYKVACRNGAVILQFERDIKGLISKLF